MQDLKYQSGFGNHFATEAVFGALPKNQNSPQKPPLGLYAEQLSGSSFLAPRHENLRTWVYRIRPSVVQGNYEISQSFSSLETFPHSEAIATPQQLRWNALEMPKGKVDFLKSLKTVLGCGDAKNQKGCAVHLYACNQSMEKEFFYSMDGDFLIVPEKGVLEIRTELGILSLAPKEIAVIPRGLRFQVRLKEENARGYVCENYGPYFRLPGLGPIGANGLANPRDFEYPVASYEDKEGAYTLIAKFSGRVWTSSLNHSLFDVVAWHGNFAPYKYDLSKFNTINTVSFDHPDPSIFTVLTSPSELPGISNIDFVIFPPRWMVAENTFRPPYYHRNCMSEYMGLIEGQYDAKPTGFSPGGGSMHNPGSGHGPDTESFEHASSAELKPIYLGNTLAFMFETSRAFEVLPWAMQEPFMQKNYSQCWQGLKKTFKKQ